MPLPEIIRKHERQMLPQSEVQPGTTSCCCIAYQQPALCQNAKWHSVNNLHLTLVFLGQQAFTAQQQLWSQSLELLQSHYHLLNFVLTS